MTFEVGACADLGAFDRSLPDRGAAAFLRRTRGVPHWICLMEDRWPDFFLGYGGFAPGAPVPLARHGPRFDPWTHEDLRILVAALREAGTRVLLGFWLHECRFAHEHHPELLMRDEFGEVWRDPVELSADLNPMKAMRADPARGVAEGETLTDLVLRRWAALQRDFGFDGLFLGDGGMGFRRFKWDEQGVRTFDFDEAWVSRFVESGHMIPHGGCPLLRPPGEDPAARARESARDVHAHHFAEWAAFNVDQWTDFYARVASAVHATGGILAAYNVMNFDPTMAYAHGADYRRLAEAGLDLLVFQTYDYAWGPMGPFRPPRKDLRTNLAALLATKAHLHGTRCRVLFTTETGDDVEHWNAPLSHTLGEVHAYGRARVPDGRGGWRPAVDGTFVVWANETPEEEWLLLERAYADVAGSTSPPRRVAVWDPRDLDLLVRMGPDAYGYGHLVLDAEGAVPLGAAHHVPEGALRHPAVTPPAPRSP